MSISVTEGQRSASENPRLLWRRIWRGWSGRFICAVLVLPASCPVAIRTKRMCVGEIRVGLTARENWQSGVPNRTGQQGWRNVRRTSSKSSGHPTRPNAGRPGVVHSQVTPVLPSCEPPPGSPEAGPSGKLVAPHTADPIAQARTKDRMNAAKAFFMADLLGSSIRPGALVGGSA